MNRIAELKGIIERAQTELTILERKEIVKQNACFIEKCFEKDGTYYRVLDVNPEDGFLRMHRFGRSVIDDYFACYGSMLGTHSLNALHEIGHREFARAWKRFLNTLQSWE